jgi:hypothetical protein
VVGVVPAAGVVAGVDVVGESAALVVTAGGWAAGSGVLLAGAVAFAGRNCRAACVAVLRAARSRVPAVEPVSCPLDLSVRTSETNSPRAAWTAVPSCFVASARAWATSESRRFSAMAWREGF